MRQLETEGYYDKNNKGPINLNLIARAKYRRNMELRRVQKRCQYEQQKLRKAGEFVKNPQKTMSYLNSKGVYAPYEKEGYYEERGYKLSRQ